MQQQLACKTLADSPRLREAVKKIVKQLHNHELAPISSVILMP